MVKDRKAVMKLGMQHANMYGISQGGTIYTLADFAMGYKVLALFPPNQDVHTIVMKMNFIQSGKGKQLAAEPEILHARLARRSCRARSPMK